MSLIFAAVGALLGDNKFKFAGVICGIFFG